MSLGGPAGVSTVGLTVIPSAGGAGSTSGGGGGGTQAIIDSSINTGIGGRGGNLNSAGSLGGGLFANPGAWGQGGPFAGGAAGATGPQGDTGNPGAQGASLQNSNYMVIVKFGTLSGPTE
jgi:hypothetical protein